MIVHSYFYGPVGNGGYDLQTSAGLTDVIDEDIIRELYTKDGSFNKIVQFSTLYKTRNGVVLAATRIEPTQSHDNRVTLINRTYFVKVEDVVADLFKLMDKPATHPITQKLVTLVEP